MLKDKIKKIFKKIKCWRILFDNKANIKWERDNPYRKKNEKKFEAQFIANKMLNDQIKETI
jgi:hypothetical protein